MSRILIIGSEGQLGSELSSFLLKNIEHDKIVLSDIRNNSSSDLTYQKLDALNYDEIKKTVLKYNISEIYHLVAILSAKGEQNPMKTWDLNMNSLFNILELAKNKFIKKVFWPSSISVFGETSPKNNTNQFCVMEPSTVYGISKLAGERWCEYYNQRYNTDIRSIRFPGIISSNTLPGGGTTDYAVEIFYSFLNNKEYKCFLNKETILPMIYIDDAINSIFNLMKENKKELSIKSSYNISGFSINPSMIFEKLNKINQSFKIIYEPDYRQKIADSWPNSINDEYAKRDWNWVAEFDLDRTIDIMIKRLKTKHND